MQRLSDSRPKHLSQPPSLCSGGKGQVFSNCSGVGKPSHKKVSFSQSFTLFKLKSKVKPLGTVTKGVSGGWLDPSLFGAVEFPSRRDSTLWIIRTKKNLFHVQQWKKTNLWLVNNGKTNDTAPHGILPNMDLNYCITGQCLARNSRNQIYTKLK